MRSHVIVVSGAHSAHGVSHTVVAYGCDRFRVCYMDPLVDPATTTPLRPPGGSGRAGKNWFCDRYADFNPAPRYLMVWSG